MEIGNLQNVYKDITEMSFTLRMTDLFCEIHLQLAARARDVFDDTGEHNYHTPKGIEGDVNR